MPPQVSHQRFGNFRYENPWDPKNYYFCLSKLENNSFLKFWYSHRVIGFLQGFLQGFSQAQVHLIDFGRVHSEFLF
jgi:hypothetical protein